MKKGDEKKTKEQLLNELNQLRLRIGELETSESNRKKAGEVGHESEEKCRELADSISDVFFEMDKDLRYTYCNKASEKLTGIASKDAVGKSIFDIFPDTEDTRRAVSVYREVLNTRQSQNFVNEHQLSGKTYFFEISVYPSKRGISVFVKDTTERKKIEEALRESEKKYKLVVENANDAILIAQDEFLKFFNTKIVELLNYSESELKSKPFTEFIHPDDRELVFQRHKQRLLGKELPNMYSYRLVDKEGNIIWVELSTIVITWNNKPATLNFIRDITERKKIEEALRESEQRYRTLYESNKDGIAGGDMEGNILECNQAFADVLGYTKEEIKKMTYQELTPKKWHKIEVDIVKNQITARGYSDEYEKEYIKKDGTIFPISCKVWFRKDEKGEVVGMCGIVRDITKHKKAEEDLRESEEKYRALVENSPNFINIFQDGMLKYVNNSMYKASGWTFEEITSPSFNFIEKIIPQRFQALLKENIAKRFRGESVPWYESALKTKDGSEIPVIVSAHLISYQGKPATEVILIDITERKKAEEVIRESEERLRLLIESAEDVILMQDIKGKYLYYSGPPKYGIKPGEVIGKTPFDFHSPENAAKFMGKVEEVVKSGKSMTYETPMDWGGEKLWFIDQMSPIKDSAGNVKGVVTISRNITEHKKAEEELAKYEKRHYQSERLAATGRLAASIAHEINNPLQAISFNLGFVKNAVTDGFKEKRSIEQIEIGTKRIKNTVKQLLDIHRSKVDVKEKVNVNESIEATLNLLKNQLMINKIEVKKSLSINIPLIIGITQELFQVFMNLILNAQDAMEKGGILNISTRVKNNKLRIIFKDNGCGTSEKDIDHIFEPFYTTKSDMLGTGLGLSTSKGIIESFSGKIDVKSMVGKGSTFTITFPIIK